MAREIVPGIFEISLVICGVAMRLIEQGLIGPRIDLPQRVAGMSGLA